jgi:hypothetical protein
LLKLYDAIPVLKENPTNEKKDEHKILVSTVVKLAILRVRVDRNEGSVLVNFSPALTKSK